MKAKIKSGGELLFSEGYSNKWDAIEGEMIINFMEKYTYKSFTQTRNHLFLNTTKGKVDIIFTGLIPLLEFESFCKDQLILKVAMVVKLIK